MIDIFILVIINILIGNQNTEQILLDNILLFVININVNINIIITRCQGSTPLKKKQFKYETFRYVTFGYRKLADVEARTLP